MNRKECGRHSQWRSNIRHFFWVGGGVRLSKYTTNISHDNRHSEQDMNARPPKYKASVYPTCWMSNILDGSSQNQT
jgi:hypothetical protein